jgi:hypothetical protein
MVHPPEGNFAAATATVTLSRVPGTRQYRLNTDGTKTRKVIVSNLPLDDVTQLRPECPRGDCTVIYGGLGGSLKVDVVVQGASHATCGTELPIEKLQVILLGIDGLRQDVLYPKTSEDGGAVESVHESGTDYYLSPADLPGIGQLFGMHMDADGKLQGDPGKHHYRFPDVVDIFPSVTLASWASIYTGAVPRETGMAGNEFFARDLIGPMNSGTIPLHPPSGMYAPGVVSFLDGAFDRSNPDVAELNAVPIGDVVARVLATLRQGAADALLPEPPSWICRSMTRATGDSLHRTRSWELHGPSSSKSPPGLRQPVSSNPSSPP